jgi:hypothetical protein
MEAVGRAWTTKAVTRRLVLRLEEESPWLASLALYSLIVLVGLPKLLAPDSWLAFVAGREIVDSGLPRRDTLTTWAAGAEWIDQQWLGQLLLYAAEVVGGPRAALLVGTAVILATFVIIAAYGRRRGASPGSVAIVLISTMIAGAASTALRTEILAYPLFAVVVGLLLTDARRPSGRVLLVVPLLVVWSNVHGSVLVGVGLAALHGLLALISRRALTGAAALLLSPVVVLATPYGFGSLDYLRQTVGNRTFPHLLEEWQATSFPADWRFFAFAVLTTALVARARDATALERLALVALLVVALTATRYTVWFVLYASMVLPPMIDREWKRGTIVRRRTTTALTAAGMIALAAGLAFVLTRPAEHVRSAYPEPVETVVAQQLARDPEMSVFASELYADWLLYEVPAARGRVAFDTRFELLSENRLRALIRLNNRVEGWRMVLSGHRLLVLESARQAHLIVPLTAERGARTLYADSVVTVILRADRTD